MKTASKLDTLLTPVGKIAFMAITKPVAKFTGDGSEYVVRLEFDLSDPEVQAFRTTIEDLNASKVVVGKADANVGNTMNAKVPAGKMQVAFKTAYTREDGTLAQPTVLDSNGNRLTGEDIPQFHSELDSGLAQVEAAVSTAGKHPTLYLRQVAIIEQIGRAHV